MNFYRILEYGEQIEEQDEFDIGDMWVKVSKYAPHRIGEKWSQMLVPFRRMNISPAGNRPVSI